MIDRHYIIHSLSIEIPVSKLQSLKEEFHKLSYDGHLNDCPFVSEFYNEMVNILSEVHNE